MMTIEQERLAWQAIVAEARRRRWRRRAVAMPGMTAVVALALVGATGLHRGGSPATRVAVGPAASGDVIAGNDPRAMAGAPIPSLDRLFALPRCTGDSSGLLSWMETALAPYLALDGSGAVAAPLPDVAAAVPVPRDAPPSGACMGAVVAGDAKGWELRGPDGTLLGRGAGTAAATRTVPARLTSQRTLYHQERVASGQPFSGVIDGSRLEGLSSASIGAVVLDVPSIATTATDSHAAGVDVLARLTFASVAPLAPEEAFQLPASAPPGFTRCSASLSYFRQTSGTVVEFCDANGHTITVGWNAQGPSGPAGRTVDVNGFAGTVSSAGAGVAVSVYVELPRAADLRVWAQSPDGVDADTLVDMLRSIPALDRRVLQPRGGGNDLRALLTDNERLRSTLEGAGATGITFPPVQTCPSTPTGADPAVPTTLSMLCRLPATISLTVPPGSKATLIALGADQTEPAHGLLPQATGVETVAGVDVLERETAGTAPVRDAGQQAVFVCGKVSFNFVGNDVINFVRGMIPVLGC